MNDGIIEEIRTLSRQFSDRVRNSGVSQSCAATRAMDNFAAGTFVSNVKLLNVVDWRNFEGEKRRCRTFESLSGNTL